MAENSKIEWTHHTFNPWIGCQNVSPGCDHCYAESMMATRLGRVEWGPHGDRRRTSPANWRKPHAWNKRATALGVRERVFCASLADVFDNHRSIQSRWRDDLWHLIDQTPHLDWLLLTKRPQNIARYLPDTRAGLPEWGNGWPNVWLGVTTENQAEADRRIPILLATPAAVRFISAEPLLGPVDLTSIDPTGHQRAIGASGWSAIWKDNGLGRAWLDLVICGGESGHGARPIHPDWARLLRDQCVAAGVAFHFKQWGAWVPAEVYRDGDRGGLTRSMTADGDTFPGKPTHWWSGDAFGGVVSILAGKAAAGRLLDGREHNDMPMVRS